MVQKQLSSRALFTQAPCVCDHGQKHHLGALSFPLATPYGAPSPATPKSLFLTTLLATRHVPCCHQSQGDLALPVTCPQRPAPRQSKGASPGTAVTRFLLQGDQQRRNTLNHCKEGKRSVMLLPGTRLSPGKLATPNFPISTGFLLHRRLGPTWKHFPHVSVLLGTSKG